MHRQELIEYLDEKCCVPSQYDEHAEDDSGQIFVNTLNGLESFVPNDDEIDDLTALRIFVRMKVTIPDDLDDYYNSVAPFLEVGLEEI
jgi:hypothetical protein